jgi:hypothetical protein
MNVIDLIGQSRPSKQVSMGEDMATAAEQRAAEGGI